MLLVVIVAAAQGFNNLANAAEVLGGYQGTVVAARRDWAKTNAQLVVGFIRAYRAGLDWLHGPANKQAAIDILRAEIPETTPAAAEENYASSVANPKGFDPGGQIDPVGAQRVLELRRRYGPQGNAAAGIGRFVDESYFRQAAGP